MASNGVAKEKGIACICQESLSGSESCAYAKKSEASSGVVALLDIIIADFGKGWQLDYEAMMKDSAEKHVHLSRTRKVPWSTRKPI